MHSARAYMQALQIIKDKSWTLAEVSGIDTVFIIMYSFHHPPYIYKCSRCVFYCLCVLPMYIYTAKICCKTIVGFNLVDYVHILVLFKIFFPRTTSTSAWPGTHSV